MSIFISRIRNMILSKLKKETKSYKFNYFEDYSSNISDDQYLNFVKIIEENAFMVKDNIIKEVTYTLSNDISNESSIINTKKLDNYIVFSLYMYIYDYKVSKKYIEDDIEITINERERPDKLVGEMFNFKEKYHLDCYIKVKLNFPSLVKKYAESIDLNSVFPLLGYDANQIIIFSFLNIYKKPHLLHLQFSHFLSIKFF